MAVDRMTSKKKAQTNISQEAIKRRLKKRSGNDSMIKGNKKGYPGLKKGI